MEESNKNWECKIDKYDLVDSDTIGINIEIKFITDWNNEKIDAKKIALIQVVKQTKDELQEDLEPQHAMTTDENTGYRVDRVGGAANPIFGAEDPKDGDISLTDKKEYQDQGKYKIGYDTTDTNRYPNRRREHAILRDNPRLPKLPDNVKRCMDFEVVALEIEGNSEDKYLGSLKWGFMWDSKELSVKEPEPITGKIPSDNFIAAAKKWNKQEEVLGRVFEVKNDCKIKVQGKWKNETFEWIESDGEYELKKGTEVKRHSKSAVHLEGTFEIPVYWKDGPSAARWGYVKLSDLEVKKSLSDPKAGNIPV